MIKASITTLTFLFTLLLGSVAISQTANVIPIDRQGDWAAIGRLTKGAVDREAGCTATLVRPDIILTAGHCLGSLRNASLARLAQERFYAGLNDGKVLEERGLIEVILPDAYQGGTLNMEKIPDDWALARLSQPIETIDPLPIVGLPGEWEDVSIVGYSRIHRTSPVLSARCPQNEHSAGIMLIRCPVINGNSGAPVLLGMPPQLQIAAVVSAKARNFAFAVIPNELLLSALENED